MRNETKSGVSEIKVLTYNKILKKLKLRMFKKMAEKT